MGQHKDNLEAALLPKAVETMMTDAILDGRCDQQFILDVRHLLLPGFSVRGTGAEPKAPAAIDRGWWITKATNIINARPMDYNAEKLATEIFDKTLARGE